MPRVKQSYTLFPRTLESGRVVFYYQTYDENGRRTNPLSTGEERIGRARTYCDRLLAEGRLVPKKRVRWEEFFADFWNYEKSPYVSEEKARDKEHITREYCQSRGSIQKNHLDPALRGRYLDAITKKDLNGLLVAMRRDKGLSANFVNSALGALHTMFSYAVEQNRITKNPVKGIRRFSPTDTSRPSFLRPAELKKIFAPQQVDSVWKGDTMHYAINLLAATSGLRKSEILALKSKNVRQDHLHIDSGYRPLSGHKSTKNRKARDIPLTDKMRVAIQPFLRSDPEKYIFSINGGSRPVSGDTVKEHFYAALRAIGIDETERNARRLTFHGWRHFFNTYMLAAGVPDSMVRSVTGHSSAAMTTNYTQFSLEHYADVASAQAKIGPGDESGAQ